jgi:hypothetical protein
MNPILNTRLMHPREQIVLVIDRIYSRGLTTTSGGNISIIDENGDIWVTPSAFQRFETLEFSARTILYGNIIGKPCYLTDNQIEEF